MINLQSLASVLSDGAEAVADASRKAAKSAGSALNEAAKSVAAHEPSVVAGVQGAGVEPKRYSAHVNGPGCITFEWQGENAVKVDLENYH